jgi:hypothetical protein
VVIVDKYDGDIRHSNTRAIRTDMGHLCAEIKQAYLRLRATIQPKYATGGVVGPFGYDDWKKANIPEYPKPGTF